MAPAGARGGRVAAFATAPWASVGGGAAASVGARRGAAATAPRPVAAAAAAAAAATAARRPVWLNGGAPRGVLPTLGSCGWAGRAVSPAPRRGVQRRWAAAAGGAAPPAPDTPPTPPPTPPPASMAYEGLTEEVGAAVRALRAPADGDGGTEAAIGGTLDAVRAALLTAGVGAGVAEQTVGAVRARAVGDGEEEAGGAGGGVGAGADAGPRFVKILYEEVCRVLGAAAPLSACLAAAGAPPAERVSPTTAILDALDEGRPSWLPSSAPAWVGDTIVYVRARPWLQLLIAFPLYTLHVLYFSTGGWKLPAAVIPNGKGLFSNVGFDTVAGAVVALGTLLIRKFLLRLPRALPPLLSSDTPPWKVSRGDKRKIANTTVLLVVAYLASGYGAVLIEQVLFLLAGLGVPLTIATTRAWKVLLGHLIWVFAGVKILRSKLNPFFPRRGSWMSWKWRTNWLVWAVGGYYVSAMFFNGADVLNHWLLPASLFNEDTVVSKLINPENRDIMAMAVGCVGPCITAPVFEEVLYRGFLLPALACYLPMWAAIPVSSVLFAVHHLNIQGVLPLTVLGFIWAILYTKSNNLAVTIVIHAMWNSRVFLSSFLGLRNFTDFE